jgi:hypothetical protein
MGAASRACVPPNTTTAFAGDPACLDGSISLLPSGRNCAISKLGPATNDTCVCWRLPPKAARSPARLVFEKAKDNHRGHRVSQRLKNRTL